MTSESSRHHHRAAKTQLDHTVVGIEHTLISGIQGLALGVLVGSSVQPMVQLQWDVWPYILTGLIAILVFWSRSLVHVVVHRLAAGIRPHLSLLRRAADRSRRVEPGQRPRTLVRTQHVLRRDCLDPLGLRPARGTPACSRFHLTGRTRVARRHPPRPARQHHLHDADGGRVPDAVLVAGPCLPRMDAAIALAPVADRRDAAVQPELHAWRRTAAAPGGLDRRAQCAERRDD